MSSIISLTAVCADLIYTADTAYDLTACNSSYNLKLSNLTNASRNLKNAQKPNTQEFFSKFFTSFIRHFPHLNTT